MSPGRAEAHSCHVENDLHQVDVFGVCLVECGHATSDTMLISPALWHAADVKRKMALAKKGKRTQSSTISTSPLGAEHSFKEKAGEALD